MAIWPEAINETLDPRYILVTPLHMVNEIICKCWYREYPIFLSLYLSPIYYLFCYLAHSSLQSRPSV